MIRSVLEAYCLNVISLSSNYNMWYYNMWKYVNPCHNMLSPQQPHAMWTLCILHCEQVWVYVPETHAWGHKRYDLSKPREKKRRKKENIDGYFASMRPLILPMKLFSLTHIYIHFSIDCGCDIISYLYHSGNMLYCSELFESVFHYSYNTVETYFKIFVVTMKWVNASLLLEKLDILSLGLLVMVITSITSGGMDH